MGKLQKIISTRYFRLGIYVIASLIVAGIIFTAGIHVGFRKARYSYQWGANYEKNFIGTDRKSPGQGYMMPPRDGVMMRFRSDKDFRNAHGLAGSIISVNENTIIVKDRDNKENTVRVGDKTLIKSRMADLKIEDLLADEQVVVMGSPDENGAIDANIIRVFEIK